MNTNVGFIYSRDVFDRLDGSTRGW